MPHDPELDPLRTVGVSVSADGPSTVDATGAYQPDTLPASTSSVVEPLDIPGYEITGEIARGGMGRVLAGRELALDREVAIKVLLPGADATRFVTESRITAKLPHPNIPPVYALGALDDGSPFLAMKYVRGRTLADELKARPDVMSDLPRFLQVFEQIAQAVGFAHSRGVIHRDLKPANVMVGEFGEVQVMDWGLAKLLASRDREGAGSDPVAPASEPVSDETRAGAIMGTPAYMAPEQARGEVADARADVFALGGILTAILTGKAVFGGRSAANTIQRAASGDTADALTRLDASGADEELVAVAKICLRANRNARPADGRAVAKLVANYRSGAEERLRESEKERGEAVVREAEQRKRRKVLAWSAAAVFAVLAAGTAVSVWLAIRAMNAEEVTADQLVKTKLAEAATAGQLVKTQEAEGKANAKTKEVEAALVIAGQRTKSLSDTYGDFVFDVTTQLEGRPGTQQLRRALLEKARAGLAKILIDARKQGTPDSTLVWSHFRMGDVEQQLGNSVAAQKEYQAGHKLAKGLVDAEPTNADFQRDLSVGFERLGTVAMKLGRTKDALDLFLTMNAMQQRLADADPNNAQALRHLSISFGKLGDISLQLGRTEVALDYYDKSIAHVRRLAEADPTNAGDQRLLSIRYDNLAAVSRRLGRTAEAFDLYQKSLAVCQRLADADPTNATAQNDLIVVLRMLGNVARQLGRTKDALGYYRKGLEVSQRLADADPTNAKARSDLGAIFRMLGELTQQLGQTDDALAYYRKGLEVSQRLADADPLNADAQRDLGISLGLLGDVSIRLSQTKDALDFHRKSNLIFLQLADADPQNASARRDLSISFEKIGDLALRLGRTKEAGDCYRECVDLRQRLADADPKDARVQLGLAEAAFRCGVVAQITQDFAEAIRWYDKSLAISERFKGHEAFAGKLKIVSAQIAACKVELAKPKTRESAPKPRPVPEK